MGTLGCVISFSLIAPNTAGSGDPTRGVRGVSPRELHSAGRQNGDSSGTPGSRGYQYKLSFEFLAFSSVHQLPVSSNSSMSCLILHEGLDFRVVTVHGVGRIPWAQEGVRHIFRI